MENGKLKLAIFDMYDGTPNQGMRAIQDIVKIYDRKLEWKVFNTRGAGEVPGMEYDIYISTGGPGNPLEGNGIWDKRYYDFIDELWAWNKAGKGPKKHVFFICHSFQMICQHFGLAEVTPRKSRSFGTFPCHKTEDGQGELFFKGLPDPFYVADFRNYQVVQPDIAAFEEMGASILALEKIRPDVPLERAMMAIRFSPEFFGTQFHPEADPVGMITHFLEADRKIELIDEHGHEKIYRMMNDLKELDRIPLTHRTILPAFLDHAIGSLTLQAMAL